MEDRLSEGKEKKVRVLRRGTSTHKKSKIKKREIRKEGIEGRREEVHDTNIDPKCILFPLRIMRPMTKPTAD